MVALKREAEPRENGKSKKAKTSLATSSFVLHSYSKLPNINEYAKAKSTPLDVFVWGTGSMCELGLGPSAKNKEVKRPRLNPYLTEEKLGGTKIVDFAVVEVLKDIDGKNGNDDDDDDDDEDGDLNEAESTPALVENLPEGEIVQLAATDNLSAALLSNGDVYAWGCFRCNEGLLGFLRDEIKLQKTPLKIKELKNIVQLAAGKDHLLALDSKGIVYAWGNGQQYQLGRRILERHRYRSLEPQQFGLYNIKYIASGDFHCFAIDHSDNVYAWGLNQYGQCALTGDNGELEDGSVLMKPTLIPELSHKGIKEIAAGEHHTLALTEDGQVYAWGRYDMKEIGIPKDKLPKSTFKDQHGNPRSVPVPTKLEFAVKIKTIGVGSHHSFAVTEDGVVYAWGFAETYGPGLGPSIDDVEKPTRIVNTATKNEDILLIGAGGQFSVSGGVKSKTKRKQKLDLISMKI
ncbi:Regulator of chromosome condensation (RCC1) repeat family protein [Candida albicans]|uniref:Regulator of chromosome condensation (RCC1) repeat family protein n=1 Tax=Candida albicans TaxID=5476 RepID=A0A8H6BTI5_CANAX|nr:Regulator of chromosome condensation (RCC1) repeat family protein [Candida albicans]